ncbi:MAG: DUF1028 domain-containing protein [Mobilicoccus sp.]|nr:DUF1028 domain-containing protein [Mobilicoccus sp.]
MTFSIVGVDPRTGDLGIAVQSKFLGVGAYVPWAQAGVGAVATQAHVDVTIGERALALLADGVAPQDCAEPLLVDDELAEHRQFGIVAADGRAAAYTGSECFDHASAITGDGFTAQGNILAGRAVVEALANAFLRDETASLAERLLAALEAGQEAGGDKRGQQSAALFVVRPQGGIGGNHDRMIDLRVDDHPTPIAELRRLYELHRLLFERPDPESALPIDETLARELATLLPTTDTPGEVSAALWRYMAEANLEERWLDEHRIDPVVLDHLRRQAGGTITPRRE